MAKIIPKTRRLTEQSHRGVGVAGVEAGIGRAVASIPKLFAPLRAFWDGLSGTTSFNGAAGKWKSISGYGDNKVAGSSVALNPFQKQMRRLRMKAETVATGRRYNPTDGSIVRKDRDMSGAKGMLKRGYNSTVAAVDLGLNLSGGAAIGAGLRGLGWATRGAVGLTGLVGYKAARTGMRAIGATAYETGVVTGQMGKGAVRLGRFPGAQDGGMAAAAAATIGIGGIGIMGELGNGAKAYNGYASSLQGTTGMAGTPLVDTGANGDLVFAMHKMR